MREHIKKFYRLVGVLEKEGYSVEVEKGEQYDFAVVTGKGVIGGFCSRHNKDKEYSSFDNINGKVSADNENVFNRWDKCSMEIPIPSNKEGSDVLLEYLRFLGTYEGEGLLHAE